MPSSTPVIVDSANVTVDEWMAPFRRVARRSSRRRRTSGLTRSKFTRKSCPVDDCIRQNRRRVGAALCQSSNHLSAIRCGRDADVDSQSLQPLLVSSPTCHELGIPVVFGGVEPQQQLQHQQQHQNQQLHLHVVGMTVNTNNGDSGSPGGQFLTECSTSSCTLTPSSTTGNRYI